MDECCTMSWTSATTYMSSYTNRQSSLGARSCKDLSKRLQKLEKNRAYKTRRFAERMIPFREPQSCSRGVWTTIAMMNKAQTLSSHMIINGQNKNTDVHVHEQERCKAEINEWLGSIIKIKVRPEHGLLAER
jgi:hypothetical protein